MRTTTWIASAIIACLTAATYARAEPQPETWHPTAGAPPAAFIILPGPRVAPVGLHVNALSVPLAVGTPLTARYAWDFGDPTGRYNTLVGFVAAHVYDRPGTYPVTLTVTDEAGHVTVLRDAVAVTPDRRRAIYVAPDGDDANIGATEAAPLRSAAFAFRHLAGGHAILMFKAGGTYPATTMLAVSAPDVVIGRYGQGPPPVILLSRGPLDIRGKPSSSGVFSIDGRTDGITIQHLTFTTPYVVDDPAGVANKVGIDAIVARGRNVVVRECSFRGVDDAVNANGLPVGLIVQGCDAPGPTDLRGYLIWGQGSDHAYLGNRAGNSTREHNIRMVYLTRVLICDNDLANLDRSKTDPSDQTKGCIQMQQGSFAYIAGNRVQYGSIRTGPRAAANEPADSATDWCVVDGNDLTDARLEVQSGSHHVMFRNNVSHGAGTTYVEISGPGAAGRTSGDLTVVHNTAVNAGPTGIFLRTWGHIDGLNVVDNLFVAPQLQGGDGGASAVYVRGDRLDGFTAVAHDVWAMPGSFNRAADGGVCVLDPGGTDPAGKYLTPAAWNATPPVADDRFADVTVDDRGVPVHGGAADGAAVPVPGTGFDHDGHPRPAAGPQTAGAFEQPR
jgi:hypothetical protein